MRHLVEPPGEIRLVAVREMPAVGEVHREDLVARLEHGKVDGHVRLRTAVRLDVDVVSAEDGLGALDGQLLDDVDVLATAIPAAAGIAFGVLVRQHGALRLADGAGGEILAGDQLDVLGLAALLGGDRGGDCGVDLSQSTAFGLGSVHGVGGGFRVGGFPGIPAGRGDLRPSAGRSGVEQRQEAGQRAFEDIAAPVVD